MTPEHAAKVEKLRALLAQGAGLEECCVIHHDGSRCYRIDGEWVSTNLLRELEKEEKREPHT